MAIEDEVIGRNVHQLMWDRRVRHRDLYEAMDLSRSSLSKKMRGEVGWSAREITIAAHILAVDPGRLFATEEQILTPTSTRVTDEYPVKVRRLRPRPEVRRAFEPIAAPARQAA